MPFDLDAARQLLARTPATLDALLRDLPDGWVHQDEGQGSWSPFDVVGHLIHGERTDWIPRAQLLLEHGPERPFEPFDRFAQERESRGKSMNQLLDEFAALRRASLATLEALALGEADFSRPGRHPELGGVTLGQLLATWVTHDLSHLAQISRAMAQRFAGEVGAWREYLPILGDAGEAG